MGKKPRKIRTEFRKNREVRTRDHGLTRQFEAHGFANSDAAQSERVSGKGDLTRQRTVMAEMVEGDDKATLIRDVDETQCLAGRVLSIRGLQ